MINLTEILQEISKLNNQELSLEVIDKIHNLDTLLRHSIEDEKDVSRIRGYEFLINEMTYVLYDLIVKENTTLRRRGVIKNLARTLESTKYIINNIVTVNNHAFIIGKSKNNLDNHDSAFLVKDYLVEITSSEFNNRELVDYLTILFDKLNNCLKEINGLDKTIYVINKSIYYTFPHFHVYISHNMNDLIRIMSGKQDEHIEIIIEDNVNNYYLLEGYYQDNDIRIINKEYYKWELNDKNKSKLLRNLL